MQVCADLAVIPAQAGINRSAPETLDKWIPACAGMTWEGLPVESDPGTLNRHFFVMAGLDPAIHEKQGRGCPDKPDDEARGVESAGISI